MDNRTALDKFRDYTRDLPKTCKIGKKCDEAALKFLQFNPNFTLMEQRPLSLKFKRLIESQPGNKSTTDTITEWEKSEFLSKDSTPCDEKKPRGRPSVTLGDSPCLKKSRTILKEAVAAIEFFANEQNLSRENALQLVIDECNRKWQTDITPSSKKSTIPVDDAVALIYNVNLSLSQYQMIRTLCLPHNMVFPTRNAIDFAKAKFHPSITSYQLKSEVNIKELLEETVTSICAISSIAEENNVLKLVGKFGVDGSGSHKIRQQLIDKVLASAETAHLDLEKTNSFLLSCYCPLELRSDNNTLLWSNPVPNSTSFARPVTLTRSSEDRDVLAVELEPSFEVIRDDYQCEVTVGGKRVLVSCKTECSMVDGKMVGLLQGDTGSFCHLCHVSREDANNPDIISDGFMISKNYATCQAAWEKICRSDTVLSSKDRDGQCHENIVKTDLFCFSVLHFKLRSLDFAQKILYHLVSGQKIWSEAVNLRIQNFIMNAKKECIDNLREKTGMLIDSPSTGGNTNCGPLADRFFSVRNREEVCSLILNTEDRNNYRQFLSLTNIVLTVIQSVDPKKRVRIDKFKHYCINLMLHMKDSFLNEKGESWVMIIPTFHQLCAHSWQLFEMNNGCSIAKWSENPVESWNKYVRSFQSGPASRSRQLSIKDNIHDIFRRMLIVSHPVIASKRPRPSCSICGEVGHTARSSKHHMSTALGEEETIIQSFYF